MFPIFPAPELDYELSENHLNFYTLFSITFINETKSLTR